MASAFEQQKKKRTAWSAQYILNNQVINISDKMIEPDLKIAQGDHSGFIAIKLNTMMNMQLPEAHRAEPDRATRFEYSVVVRITLHSKKNNFFGRTYASKQIPVDSTTLKPDGDQMNEYALFYSKFVDEDLSATAEFVLTIREKSAQAPVVAVAGQINTEEEKKDIAVAAKAPRRQTQPQKVLGVGFCVIPLFDQNRAKMPVGVKSVDILQGSPRILLTGRPIENLKKSGMSFKYEILYAGPNEHFTNLMYLIPSEILVGPNDRIPGIKITRLPAPFAGFDQAMEFTERKTLYAHEIRITSINDIENNFSQYLRTYCIKTGAQKNTTVTAEIKERKLTMVPHNTWRQIGDEAMISLNKEFSGNIESSGILKILDYSMHSEVALIIKLQYRVQIKDA